MRRILVVSLLLFLTFGCTSRYRLDLFVTDEGSRGNAKVLQREFIVGSQLADPYADVKVVPGTGNTIVVTMNRRGQRHATEYGSVLGYDESLRYRLYVHLPGEPSPQTIPLAENSFVNLVGRYDLPAESKIYRPTSGEMVIDSISKGHLFATVNAQFANSAGAAITLDGRVKLKITR